MKYLCLLHADESKAPAMGSPEMDQLQAAYGKFFEEASGAGVFAGGDPVQNSSTAFIVRLRDGHTQRSAGTFAPDSDPVIGYYVFECASDDEAAGYAAKIPAAGAGAIEVRPILVQG